MDSQDQPDAAQAFKNDTIQAGNTVLLRLPNREVRGVRVEEDSTITLGRVGSFYAKHLIGQPCGLTYEISDKELTVISPRTLREVEDTDATNELINDGEFVQPLTLEEIEMLKRSGVHASDIINKQIQLHANYSLKTEYSKEKYRQRKEAKYSKTFTTIEPSLFNVCSYWFTKDQNRIRDIRPDTISQMMVMANIRPGGRYIAVDDASGMIVSGVLERMGGEGRLITICDVDSPPAYPVLAYMNFSKDATSSIMTSLNWATVQGDYTPVLAPVDPPPSAVRSERQRSRFNKRKAVSDSLFNTREELFAGEFDGLIVSTEYDAFEVVEALSQYLAGSAPIVVQSPHVQTMAELQAKMRPLPHYLGPSLTEGWLRRYQVLPGRTHPTMNTSGSGGFILQAIKVYDDPSASSVLAHRRGKTKKRKILADGGVDEGTTAVLLDFKSEAEDDLTIQADAIQNVDDERTSTTM